MEGGLGSTPSSSRTATSWPRSWSSTASASSSIRTGQTVAGALRPDGKGFVDVRAMLRGQAPGAGGPGLLENTTIAVVATNAQLTKVQATRVAQRAHDRYARAIYPSHTSMDGDAIFAMATGTLKTPANPDQIGTLAADAVAEAILRAVRAATGIPGYPAVRNLNK